MPKLRHVVPSLMAMLLGAQAARADMTDLATDYATHMSSDNEYGLNLATDPSYLYFDAGLGHARVVCGSFAAYILEQTYPVYKDQDLLFQMTGEHHPRAARWYDAIDLETKAFYTDPVNKIDMAYWLARSTRVNDILAEDDVVVAKYDGVTTITGDKISGHVMIPAKRPVETAGDKLAIGDTVKFDLAVTDATEEPHGAGDVRPAKGGVGQGTIRLYVRSGGLDTLSYGKIVAWQWSTDESQPLFLNSDPNDSHFVPIACPMSLTCEARPLLIGTLHMIGADLVEKQ
jgi:hypothetical protein